MTEDLSRRLSWVLDNLGCRPVQRRLRRLTHQAVDECTNKLTGLQNITVGSKGEGLTNFFESDTDTLIFQPYVVCIEHGIDKNTIKDPRTTVFECDMTNSYPGHMLLELVHNGCIRREVIYDSLVKHTQTSKVYLSRSSYSKKLLQQDRSRSGNYTTEGLAGPAIQWSHGIFEHDSVHVIPFYCPSLLRTWSDRPRNQDWPARELINKCVEMGAVAAPTAFDNSQNTELEWRMCFNMGENELTDSLPETLIKVYVLLKTVKSSIIKPENKEITSYLLKNIVYWMAELYPSPLFTESTLFYWLSFALLTLKDCVAANWLPYYMIPARNLLEGKMKPHQRKAMLCRIDEVIAMGPDMLRSFPRIYSLLTHADPEKVNLLSRHRDELEIWLMFTEIREAQLVKNNEPYQVWLDRINDDAWFNDCYSKILAVVLPNARQVRAQGLSVVKCTHQKLKKIFG